MTLLLHASQPWFITMAGPAEHAKLMHVFSNTLAQKLYEYLHCDLKKIDTDVITTKSVSNQACSIDTVEAYIAIPTDWWNFDGLDQMFDRIADRAEIEYATMAPEDSRPRILAVMYTAFNHLSRTIG